LLRPRLVYATAVRVGLGTGLGGQEIPLSERFFAGGSTTIRGFPQNSVGPATIGTVYPGGNAMLVLNNELRFPMINMFDGVAFVDVGNVYPHVSDFSLSNVRSAAGFGLRVRTPWLLLRLDYGFKLDRRPGESVGRLFFSIAHHRCRQSFRRLSSLRIGSKAPPDAEPPPAVPPVRKYRTGTAAR